LGLWEFQVESPSSIGTIAFGYTFASVPRSICASTTVIQVANLYLPEIPFYYASKYTLKSTLVVYCPSPVTIRVNRTKLMPNDVVKAIGALTNEERDTVLDAIMMQNEDF
jgi:hypothetical protein